MRKLFTGLFFIPLLTGCSVFGVNSVEEASYDVIKTQDKYELRLYDPVVVVETTVNADFDKAGTIAFRKLFDYISGENQAASKIAMTAPVIVNQYDSEDGERIEMTAPVLEQRTDQGWRYMFVLPASYSIDTAPVPTGQNVQLATMPEKRVAVIQFSGLWDEALMEQKTDSLKQWITANNLTATSPPRWAGYNPPWTLPFLRRNEVMIDVN